MSWGSFSRERHCGSRRSPKPSAASAHCTFRWAVGTITTTREARLAISVRRAAISANVVLPAPGVATARKSGSCFASNFASASTCHRRSVGRPLRFFAAPMAPPTAHRWVTDGASRNVRDCRVGVRPPVRELLAERPGTRCWPHAPRPSLGVPPWRWRSASGGAAKQKASPRPRVPLCSRLSVRSAARARPCRCVRASPARGAPGRPGGSPA